MVHFAGYIFSLAPGASSFNVGDLWLSPSVKALNKSTALCHAAGNRIFPFSFCTVPHTNWIDSHNNYETWGYRVIIDCNHMPLKRLSDCTMKWLEIPFGWCCHLSQYVLGYQSTEGFHSRWDVETIPETFAVQARWAIFFPRGLTSHMYSLSCGQKEWFLKWVYTLEGSVRFWLTGYKKKTLARSSGIHL